VNAPLQPPLTLDEARALRAAGEWQALLDRTLSLGEDVFREPEMAFLLAVGLRRTGRTSRALETLARVEPEVRRRGDRWTLGEVINLRGIAQWESGRAGEAEATFGELLEAATEWGDEESTSRACNNLGVLAHVRGRRDLALTLYQRALAAYQRLGNVRGLAETHHNLGITYRELGFDRDADAHFHRAVELATGAGLQDVIALADTERAGLRVRWRDGRLASEMARRALERFRRISDPTGAANALRILGLAAQTEGDLAQAETHLDEALEIAKAHEDAMIRAEVQRDRGALLRDRERIGEARAAIQDSIDHFAQIGAAAEAEALRAILDSLP
jgi:tetratricopeptide (TPR) repeat protein